MKKTIEIELTHIGEDYGTIKVGDQEVDVSLWVVEVLFGKEAIE